MGNEQPKQQKVVSSSELQTYVMIIQAKLTQGRNKKVLEISKKRNEIKELLKEKGFFHDADDSKKFQNLATLSWLKDNMNIYKKLNHF